MSELPQRKPSLKRFYSAELFFTFAIFAAFTCFFTAIRESQSYKRMGDTLIFEQAVDNLAHGKGATSSIFSSTQVLIDSDALSATSERYLNIVSGFDANVDRSILGFHADLILILLACFRAFARSASIIACTDASCFSAMALTVYLWLRTQGVSWASSVIFVLLLMMHPAWGVSISGQFYPDRMFLPLGLLFFIAIHQRWKLVWTLPVAVLAISINERAFTVMGLFLLGYAVCFFSPSRWRLSAIYFVVGLALVEVGSAIQTHVLQNVYYGSFMPVSLSDALNRFSAIDFRRKLVVFGLINAGFVFLSLFRWRAVPILLGLMVPNIVGSIGGAEKTGFPTHYHTYYFPSLVWGAALGYTELNRLVARGLTRLRFRALLTPITVALTCTPVVLAHLVDWTRVDRARLSWPTARDSNILFTMPANWRESFGEEGVAFRTARDQAIAAVPPGSRVSSVEAAMWTAVDGGSRISIYPFGLSDATLLLVNCEALPEGGWTWSALPSFLPAADRKPVEDAFRNRARALGFDVDHPACAPPPFQIGLIPRRIP